MKPLLVAILGAAFFVGGSNLANAQASTEHPKGSYDGITVIINRAEISSNGKLVVVTAHNIADQSEFVLVCEIAGGYCAMPRIGSTYRVISVVDQATEAWGLVRLPTKKLTSIFTLAWAGAQ